MRRTIALGHRYFDIPDDDTPTTGGGFFYPESYGTVGTSNDAAAFQAAADAAELAGGGIVKTTPGFSYKLTQVQLGDNVHLDFTASKLIRANAATATGIPNATVRNKDMVSGNMRIKVYGGEIASESSAAIGPHFGFYACKYLTLTDWLATSIYGDWNTKIRDCQFVEFGGTVDDGFGSTLNDGLHVVGGSDIVIRSGNLHTGDDSISLTTAPAQSPFPASNDLTRVVVLPHTTRPSKARNLLIQVNSGATGTISSILVGAVAGRHDGTTSGLSIKVNDATLAKAIFDIDIGPFVIDATNGSGDAVTLAYCKDVRVRGAIRNPGARSLVADNVDGLTVTLDSSGNRAASSTAFAFQEVTDLRVKDSRADSPTQHGFALGVAPITATGAQTVAAGANLTVSSTTNMSATGTLLLADGTTTAYSAIVDATHITLTTGGTFTAGQVLSPNPVTRWSISDVTVTTATQNYALINGGYEGRIRNGHAPGCAKGIVEAGNSDWNAYEFNDMSGVASTPLTITGAHSVGFRNRGITSRLTDAHGINLNIVDFGADPTGTTDSTSAIQAAFTAAATTGSVAAGAYATGGNPVYAPPGLYKINTACQIPDRVDLVGAGTTLTAFLCTTATAQLVVGASPPAKGNPGVGSRGGTTKDFTIDGNAVTTVAPFRVNVAVQRSFKNIRVYNSVGHGALIYGAQNCSFEQFNCESNGNPLTNLGSSLVLDAGAGNNTFVKCEIADAAEYNMKLIQTVSQRQGCGTNPNANLFVRCLFERVNQGQDGCVYLGSGDQNSFEYCHFQFPTTITSPLTTIRHDNLFSDKSQRWTFHNCFWQGNVSNTTAVDILGSIPNVFFTGENYMQNHLVGVVSDATSGLYGLQSFHVPDNVATPFAVQ